MDPELFFVGSDQDATPAKRVCGVCPVRAQCLAFAIQRNERFGVWGGLTERERRYLSEEDREAIVRRADFFAA